MTTNKEIRRSNLLVVLEEFPSQAALARVLEVEPAYVSALLAGPPSGRDIGDRTARKIEAKLNKPAGWMDQLQKTVVQERQVSFRYRGQAGSSSRFEGVALVESLQDVPQVAVPRLEVRASMGAGELRHGIDAVVGKMELNVEWVRRHLPDVTATSNLRVITGIGDSMEPTFRDGDILLVDVGVHEVRIDAAYVFAIGDELFIKTLQRVPGSGLRVISDNKKYEPYVLNAETKEPVEIVGRVRWVWNGRKM
jgi:phage repressor protein C with HTH and peptisase S24 domain